MSRRKYEIGEKINGFEVLDIKYKPYKTNAKHRLMLLCKCPLCGKEKWFYAFAVASGRQKSCGCLPKNINSTEKAKELRAKSKGAEEYRKDGTFLPALVQHENHQHGDMSLPRGVSRAGKRFSATIHFKGVRYYLGRFDTAEEAGEAYLKARKELHGKYISELREKDPSTYEKYERLVKKAEKREQ